MYRCVFVKLLFLFLFFLLGGKIEGGIEARMREERRTYVQSGHLSHCLFPVLRRR